MQRPAHKLWLALALCALPVCARADAAPPTPEVRAASHEQTTPVGLLAGHLTLLEKKGLAPAAADSVDELDAVLEEAHQRALLGSKDEAAMLLLEAVEGPRFRSFESLDSFAAADLMLASLLLDQRALLSAQRSVDRLLARGVQTPTFGPAYRRAVDIALARGDHAQSADALAAKVEEPLPEDATSELHYLRGLAAHENARPADSRRELAAVTKKSRFYGNAQYLLGAIAAADKQYDEASARFCAVREIARGAPRTRYESAQRYQTADAAQLGLGRIAHEQGRSKEAFEHYFRLPSDSPLIAEALFESAYASYEQGHPRTALDSLEQLEARYPDSPYTAEARVLRGYAHLASCDFARAEIELAQFEATFGRVLRELDATLASPQRTRSLFVEHAGETRPDASSHDVLLLGLVRRDPEVERWRASLASLDAELARSSRVGEQLSALAARVRNKELPAARSEEADSDERTLGRLHASSSALHDALAGQARALRTLRDGGGRGDQLAALGKQHRQLEKRSDTVDAALRQLVRRNERLRERPTGAELGERLEQDRAYVAGVRSRALRVREDLQAQLAQAELRALGTLRERLEKELRRARIGRIDAVMGKKRKLELEVESLSAGRFPAELKRRKQTPTLLSDDEEYWPYEGEDWPDEYEERQ